MKKLSKRRRWDTRLLGAMDGVEKVAIRATSLAGLAWIIIEILKHHLHF